MRGGWGWEEEVVGIGRGWGDRTGPGEEGVGREEEWGRKGVGGGGGRKGVGGGGGWDEEGEERDVEVGGGE